MAPEYKCNMPYPRRYENYMCHVKKNMRRKLYDFTRVIIDWIHTYVRNRGCIAVIRTVLILPPRTATIDCRNIQARSITNGVWATVLAIATQKIPDFLFRWVGLQPSSNCTHSSFCFAGSDCSRHQTAHIPPHIPPFISTKGPFVICIVLYVVFTNGIQSLHV